MRHFTYLLFVRKHYGHSDSMGSYLCRYHSSSALFYYPGSIFGALYPSQRLLFAHGTRRRYNTCVCVVVVVCPPIFIRLLWYELLCLIRAVSICVSSFRRLNSYAHPTIHSRVSHAVCVQWTLYPVSIAFVALLCALLAWISLLSSDMRLCYTAAAIGSWYFGSQKEYVIVLSPAVSCYLYVLACLPSLHSTPPSH